jgi:hypothetical protein
VWDATAVRTIPAQLRPPPGGRAPPAAAGLAVAALTLVSGLQLLRLMVATLVGVYRDRLVVQLVPDAVARWLLAPVGVVLFCWFVPLWLARDGGRGLALALLAGLAADTALAGLFGSWDYAWSIDGWSVALAVLLAAAAGWGLAAAGDPGPERPEEPAGRAGLAVVLPLAGVGPALFLHALVWQNLGWQAVLGGRSQEAAFLLVMAGNLAALAAGTAAALGRRRPPPRGVLGQAAGAGAGLGPTAAAWTAGMGLFVLLVLTYYAAYDLVLPVGNGLLPALAAVLVGLAAAGVMRIGRDPGGQRRDLVPVWAGVALLAAPLLFWATAPARSRPPLPRPGRCG